MEFESPWPIRIFTVSQLTARIKETINKQFREVLVEGEVSNFKVYPSGHLYFTLKDDTAALRGVMFNYQKKHFGPVIKDGTAVICRGRIDVYEKRGDYQLIADDIEVRGLGMLQVKFEMLKAQLFEEGLFDTVRKRPLPLLPHRIGIVTSPAGAAIRDMLKIIYDKCENIQVAVYPVRVQGEEACGEIIEGIGYFNKAADVDVIIVGRGGGSYEDLAAFNDEAVARAIHASTIPVVSAVGHEIDFTIADFVADLRAPTPTAAADMVVPDKAQLSATLARARDRLRGGMIKLIKGSRLLLYKHSTDLKEKQDFLIKHRMYVDDLASSLTHNFDTCLRETRNRLQKTAQRLQDLNPQNILKRGYAIALNQETGAVITTSDAVTVGDNVSVKLYRGKLDVVVEKVDGVSAE